MYQDSICKRSGLLRQRKSAGSARLISLCCLLLLSLAGVVFLPRIIVAAAGGDLSACTHQVGRINRAVEMWYFDRGFWPRDDLGDIGRYLKYLPDGLPTCPVNGRPYVLNPRNHRVQPHGH